MASAPIIAPVKDGSVLPTSLNVPNASVLEQYYDSLEGLSIDVTPSVFESYESLVPSYYFRELICECYFADSFWKTSASPPERGRMSHSPSSISAWAER